MFADTLTITINAVPFVLQKINQDGYASEYLLRNETDEMRLKIRNSTYVDSKVRPGKTIHRHTVEFVQTFYPVAPSTAPVIRKSYVVFENEAQEAAAAIQNVDVGFVGFLTAANILKLINFES